MEKGKTCPITIVFSFDKALPLTKPLHADAVYDHWRLLLLECLVELQRREREKKGERKWGRSESSRDKREEKQGRGGAKKN